MRSVVLAAVLLLAACGSSKPAGTQPLPESRPGISSGGDDGWDTAGPEQDRSRTYAANAGTTTAGSAPTKSPSAAPTKSAGGKGDPTAQAFVDAHNRVRAKHCAPPLTWSAKLAEVAQSWANELERKGCVFGHSGATKYGENLAAGTIGALSPESTVAMWYDEIELYKFPSGGFSMETGHFTQVVWTTTTRVGCGHVQCKGNDIYVCNYDPPGNWKGQYREHVLPASCKK